ncbi:formylglycine-generating enzyme family protein [Pseudomonas sp. WMBT8]|uniref:formylglycine-generating enzyme family protein n=1 Tax=Pseudomonas sp. WMBT8 TaxID=3414496 RepID=UPI003D801969
MNAREKVVVAEKCTVTSPLDPCEQPVVYQPQTGLLETLERMNRFRETPEAAALLRSFEESTDLSRRLQLGTELAIKGDPRIIAGALNNLVSIPAGEAHIGIDESKIDAVVREYADVGVIRDWILKEVPRHTVSLAGFNISKYPVTNLEYLAFLRDCPNAEVPTSWPLRAFPLHYANHPVYSVSAGAADAFCAWLSARTGRTVRLPDEAQWEYAAGAGRFEYPWGNEARTENANTAELGLLSTTPVGVFPQGASPFGLMDMGGNVEEYTSNDYDAYPNGPFVMDDLISESRPTYRITRGGCFGRFADLCRVSRRHGLSITPYASLYAVGFRVVAE